MKSWRNLEEHKIVTFDAILAFGVFPHVDDENISLKNLGKMLNENGRARSHDKHDKLFLVKPRCIEIK